MKITYDFALGFGLGAIYSLAWMSILLRRWSKKEVHHIKTKKKKIGFNKPKNRKPPPTPGPLRNRLTMKYNELKEKIN